MAPEVAEGRPGARPWLGGAHDSPIIDHCSLAPIDDEPAATCVSCWFEVATFGRPPWRPSNATDEQRRSGCPGVD